MPLNPFAFTPPQGFRDVTFAPTDPQNETAFRDTMQDIPDQLRDELNSLYTKLNSTTDGSSGADVVSATPLTGGTANTIQGILEELKAEIDLDDGNNVKLTGNQTVNGEKTFVVSPQVPTPDSNGDASNKGYVDSSIAGVVLGQIPDGSLTDVKLSNDSGMIKSRVNVLNTINTTSGTSPNFLVSNTDVNNLYEGLKVTLKFHESSIVISTVKFNDFDAKGLKKSNGNDLTNVPLNSVMTFVYDGLNFILQGEGGEYGTATPAEVLTGYTLGTENGVVIGALSLSGDSALDDVIVGKTFYNTDAKTKRTGTLALTGNAVASEVLSGKTFYNTNPKSKLTGTIPSKTAQTYTPSTVNQTIASGQYLSGTQTIFGDADLIASNIKSGVNIFNVVGNVVDGTDMKKIASGSTTTASDGTLTVGGLTFTPRIIFIEWWVNYIVDWYGTGNFYYCGNNTLVPVSTSGGYVNSTGFKLSTGYPNTSSRWIAIS